MLDNFSALRMSRANDQLSRAGISIDRRLFVTPQLGQESQLAGDLAAQVWHVCCGSSTAAEKATGAPPPARHISGNNHSRDRKLTRCMAAAQPFLRLDTNGRPEKQAGDVYGLYQIKRE